MLCFFKMNYSIVYKKKNLGRATAHPSHGLVPPLNGGMNDVNGAAGLTNVDGAADMVLPEMEAELEKVEVEAGLFKDLVVLCLQFIDIAVGYLVCRIGWFIFE